MNNLNLPDFQAWARCKYPWILLSQNQVEFVQKHMQYLKDKKAFSHIWTVGGDKILITKLLIIYKAHVEMLKTKPLTWQGGA